MRMKALIVGILTSLIGLSGCCSTQQVPTDAYYDNGYDTSGKTFLTGLPMVRAVQPWQTTDIQTEPLDGLLVQTTHYDIFTTVSDPLILRQLPFFLESAFEHYCELIGKVPSFGKKLTVYFFISREQWEQFTRKWAGMQAQNYLQIRSGAYYLNGACVTYHLGRQENFSVLAHEGWHQFSDAFFEQRPPSWLDEGMATQFEAWSNRKGDIQFDARRNGGRLFALKTMLEQGTGFSLNQLLTLDAGAVLAKAQERDVMTATGGDPETVNPKAAAFYAQVYALGRFMREYRYGQYRNRFENMMADGLQGHWPAEKVFGKRQISKAMMTTRRWTRQMGPLIFAEYIGPDIAQLEAEYQSFCRKIVAETRFKP